MPSQPVDYYALLGVDPGADALTIRKAWAAEQRLWGVRQNAPDLAARHAAELHVQLLAEVRDVLLDPSRRAQYDRARTGAKLPSLPPSGSPRREDPSPLPSPSGRGGLSESLSGGLPAVAAGLAGALIAGSQVFHLDLPMMIASTLFLSIPVYAFNVLGLRTMAWPFRTRARGAATWLVLSVLLFDSGLWALADLNAVAVAAAVVPAATLVTRAATPAPGQEITLPDGLHVTDTRTGTGAVAETGKTVSVLYTAWLADGTRFDGTPGRNQPFSFPLGRNQVIKGWDEGIAGMKVGGKRTLLVPANLGYGARGAVGIVPPNTALKFEIELVEVN